MPFWNGEVLKFMHELAVRSIRDPILFSYADDDVITSFEISKGTYGGSRGSSRRNRPAFTYRNEKAATFNTYHITDLLTKEALLIDHFRAEGLKFMINEGKTVKRILLTEPIMYGDLRKMLNHFISVYP